MKFNFFNNKFISFCSLLLMLVFLNLMRNDIKVYNIIKNGEIKDFYISEINLNSCNNLNR